MLNTQISPSGFGTDPEGFLTIKGKIIGSEKLIPEYGLDGGYVYGKVVRDGVQFELNPQSSYIPRNLGQNIAALLKLLQQAINRNDQDMKLCFDGLVEVSREELDSLSEKSRVLGCMPSHNVYGDRPINVDATTYRKRSAGGHIHFGISDHAMREDLRRMVPVCDTLVGLPSVLLDRDKGAAERRENYGRAGEFRLPEHGLEYRTTSNYWLRNPSLFNFVFRMAEAAYALTHQAANGDKTIWNDLVDVVDINSVQEAINTNNFTLARQNLTRLVPFIKKHFPKSGYPLTPRNLDDFISFGIEVDKKGIEKFFPTSNVVRSWVSEDHIPFEKFLEKL